MASNLRKPREQDIEMGPHHGEHVADGDTCDESDNTGSLCFSDAEDHSWRHSPHSAPSPNNSNPSVSVSPYNNTDADTAASPCAAPAADPCRKSCVSDCSLETDLESGLADPEIIKGSPNTEKAEKICRICHLCLEGSGPETGTGIVLGCSCKDDLAAAHRQCAETWFKIKGNKTCEICGSTARNVIGTGETEFIEHWNDANSNNTTTTPVVVTANETRRFWQGHRFLNFLLACMVFAFVISWLFHFNVPG
ncbi:RING/FYVE/PHD zinc finger superfamily protein [Rhynchospora pubera]|uniref:RING/FYVE/PHD zinc finger superfamily protein n=1 Tax=Rhynchospora pubera TaxID=906938 RepID=A0AAV8DEA3_9POAL|nr:RING/FYVE/PHD zinc finger superfamily protein [Rhynchospora pubera]